MLSSPFPTRFKGIDPVRAPRVISYQPFPTALSMFSPLIQARGLLIGRSEDSWHRGSLLLDCSSSRKPSGSYPRKRRSANELIDCTFSTRYRRLLTIAHRIKGTPRLGDPRQISSCLPNRHSSFLCPSSPIPCASYNTRYLSRIVRGIIFNRVIINPVYYYPTLFSESSIRTFKKEYSNYYKIEGRPVENFHDKNKITRRINVTRLHINGRHDNLVFISLFPREMCSKAVTWNGKTSK